ncbi:MULTISPECIES: HigA family addiction module antitoxin [Rhodococcus]|uniref:HigA family addiction module antitoxin n=1 Tax=Rhodococcus TaxID=1827 RepID=UPI0015E0A167|nr:MULTISPECIES: HigA family addiction module antitoxin [Rhodococcus]WKX01768.1 HigA family addiction module antitoxin [Rhodococcus aetherivorans]
MAASTRQRKWHPYQPTSVPVPGETLRETLEALEMSQSKLAARTGLTLKHINQIVQGNAAISPDTAVAFERATGVDAQIWNALETRYQDHQIRANEVEVLESHRQWLEQMPLVALRKLGYVTADKRRPGVQLQEALKFFGVANIQTWDSYWKEPAAAFLQSSAFTADAGAVAAWLRIGELAAAEVECEPFDRAGLKAALPSLRRLTVKDPREFLPELRSICASVGVCVVLVREVPGARASGVSRFLSPSKALIQLSNRGKRNDKFWFAFFHEVAHLVLHSKKETFVEFEKGSTGTPEIEREANDFAARLLIPAQYDIDLEAIQTSSDAVALADRIGVAAGIVAGRIQRDRQEWTFGVAAGLFRKYEIVHE